MAVDTGSEIQAASRSPQRPSRDPLSALSLSGVYSVPGRVLSRSGRLGAFPAAERRGLGLLKPDAGALRDLPL